MNVFKYIGCANGALSDTGTIACGNAVIGNLQVFLDSNSTFDIAVKPTTSATGTASKNNCSAVLTDNGCYEVARPAAGVRTNWYLAYRVYNGSTAGSAGDYDKYALEKLG